MMFTASLQLAVSELAAVPPLRHTSRTDDGMRIDLRKRLDHLLTIWTVKEAYIKALGHGLSMDLKRIEVSFQEAAFSALIARGKVDIMTGDDSDRPANSETRCNLCEGTVTLIADNVDIQKGTTNGWRWHMQLGIKRIKDKESQSGCQEYVWASLWTTAAGERCEMEEMMGQCQGDLHRLIT